MYNHIYSYSDDSGTVHPVSDELLTAAVNIKTEFQKTNGKCNWKQLKQTLELDGYSVDEVVPCEGFRLCVKNYQQRHFREEDVVDSDTIARKIGKLNSEKRDLQNVSRQFNALRRRLADKTILVDRVTQAIKKTKFVMGLLPTDLPKFEQRSALLATFADLHLGAEVDMNENRYNLEIAKERIEDYRLKLVEMATNLHVSDLYIANIGDMVENVYMRFTQGFDTELGFGDQIKYAMEYIGDFLVSLYQDLSPIGIKIHYTGIAGNHDRISGNKKENIYGDNVAVVINSFVKYLSLHQLKSEYFDYIEPDTIYRTHLNILGQLIKVVHGDLDNITKDSTFGKIAVYDDQAYRLIIGGHLHRYSVLEVGNKKYMVTSGSFKGSDKFSDSLSKGSSLSQAVVWIKENGDLINMNVEINENSEELSKC